MKYTMQIGKTLLIVSGGSIDINFSKEYIKDKKYYQNRYFLGETPYFFLKHLLK